MYKQERKIDIVIPWVNGNDEEWQKEKSKYAKKDGDDDRPCRYRDLGLLKYWFRGIEKYAPWVNKIFFLTYGHLPDWLDTSNPKLIVVNHKEFIPSEYLPTFSSHVIELNMHRIKGLSDKFIYFNDDVFLLRSVYENDFFKEDLPCDCLVESGITPRLGEFSSILCETVGVINRNFTKEDLRNLGVRKNFNIKYGALLFRTISMSPYHHIMGFYNHHICQAYNKSIFEEVWDSEYDELDKTCRNKFRGKNDVNQYLFRYWNLCKGDFYPKAPIGKCLNQKENASLIVDVIKQQKYKVLTINDSDIEIKDDEIKAIKLAFEKILGEKSSYEL